jgi:hypothetical protein
MTLSPIAGALLSEQFELIREIARNLVGEAEPSGARLATQATQRLPDGVWLGDGDSSGAEGTSYGNAADRSRNAAPALSLFGLRPAFAGLTGSAASQGTEIQRLIEILARTAAPGAAVETTRPAGESVRPNPGETDMPPTALVSRNGVPGTPPRVGSAIVSGDTGMPMQSDAETPRSDDVAIPARTAVTSGMATGLARPWATGAPLWAAMMPGQAGMAAETGDARSGEQMAALAGEPPDHQARLETTPAMTRAAQGHSSHQAILSDKADAPSRAPADLAHAANTVSTMVADLEGAIRNAIVDRNLAALGLGDMADQIAAQMTAQATSAAPERAGVIASFILNAHFQPGWPPLRPIQGAQAAALAGKLAQAEKLIGSEKDMLIYLANFGVNIEQLARILKLAAPARHRSKLLTAILGFLVNFSTVVRLLQEELAALLDDLGVESQLLPRTASGKRLRTDLR